jgi:PAS domain S-box-containing protein
VPLIFLLEWDISSPAMNKNHQDPDRRFIELELIYKTAPVGLALVDTDLRYLRVNDRLAQFTGCMPEDLVGKTIQEIVPSVARVVEPIYRRVIETGEPSLNNTLEGIVLPGSDARQTFLASYHPLIDAGAVRYISVGVQNISDLKKALESFRWSDSRFHAFMDHSPAVIYIKDEKGRHVYGNKTMLDLFGVRLEQFVGTASRDWLPPDMAEAVEKADQAIWSGASSMEILEQRTEMLGKESWLRDIKFPLEAPSGGRYLGGICVDVTAQKQSEQSLKDQLEFERLISELSAEFINISIVER